MSAALAARDADAAAPGEEVDQQEEDESSDDSDEEEEEDDEEENAVDDDDEEDDDEGLPDIMGQDDPRRMKLTSEEYLWALDIMRAIKAIPEIDNLSDFFYAQLAIICENDVEDAVNRARALQYFRQEYDVQNTVEDGHRAIHNMVGLMPNFYLSFQFSPADGTYCVIHDDTKVETMTINTPEKITSMCAGSYYVMVLNGPDLESIRKGMLSMAECQGLDYTMRQDFKLILKIYNQLLSVYPFRGRIMHYHTGVVFNVMATMAKKTLPTHLRDQFQTGLIFEERLDKFFLVPTPEAATKRLLESFEKALRRRFANERTFSLSDPSVVIDDN